MYTDKKPPSYKDPFWEIRKLLRAWNDNMAEVFSASWVSCLDESMTKWVNAYTCPGFMFVPRKPWPFGNEFHTIACGETGILYALELVEGKDQPQEVRKEHSELGKTVSLLLRLTKSLWASGKVVVLDSGFCVLQGIIELKKKGVFAAALIKKRQYWPKHIDGDRIKSYFDDKLIRYVDALPGRKDGVPFHIFAMKEPDYCMMLMSTYGTLERSGDNKNRNSGGRTYTFKYPEVIANHYKYRDSVDSHNARRQSPIALEETWATDRWPNRIFAYILATTEVNANLANAAFGTEKKLLPQLKFRQSLAKELINNPYRTAELNKASNIKRSKRIAESLGHDLVGIPPGMKFSGVRLVKAQTKYPLRKCECGKARVRTYCTCSPGTIWCIQCFASHVINLENKD